MTEQLDVDIVVVGSGPGGYAAAFRAADMGQNVALVEQYSTLGGVCLNVGCIPSKTLLHAAKVIDEAAHLSEHGIDFGTPTINHDKLRDYKNQVVKKLTQGIQGMAKQRKVQTVQGYGKFVDEHTLAVDDHTQIKFDKAIIAVGSRAIELPFMPEDDSRIMTSTSALEIEETDCDLLMIGGGIIGLEMANVYRALGANVKVVEFMSQIAPTADADIIKPLQKRMEKQGVEFWLETKVTDVKAKKDGLYVTFEGKNAPEGEQKFDRILQSVGRKPNGNLIDADKAGVEVDDQGFINVDEQLRTNVDHIFAIGDVIGQPMLAHKGTHEGHVAAEVAAGKKHYFTPKCIPSVAYTDPEVAWTGVTEKEAKEQGIEYEKGVFPWMASGRSLSQGRDEGTTKILFDKQTNQVIGGGIVGPNAGELIAEIGLAIEMGCDAEDVALTIHPHPSISETVGLATEMYTGTATDLIPPKPKKD